MRVVVAGAASQVLVVWMVSVSFPPEFVHVIWIAVAPSYDFSAAVAADEIESLGHNIKETDLIWRENSK